MDNTIDDNIEDKERHELNESNINYNELSEESDNEIITDINAKHINAKHIDSNTSDELKCDECDRLFKTKKYLRAHKTYKHSLRVGTDVKYKCDWSGCEFETKYKSNLIDHTKRHKGIKRYPCLMNGCEFETKYKCSLDQHLKLHERIKASPRVRPSREIKFTNSADNKLPNTYSDSRPYVCDWSGCEAKFRDRYNLQNHKRIHLGKNLTKDKLIEMIDRNEVIEEIDENNALLKVFKGSRVKKSFLNKTLGFGCNWNECQYISCQRKDVISHISRKHTKEKFICDECERVFHCEKDLKFHKSRIHKLNSNFRYKCHWNGCEFETNYKSNLNLHIKRHKGVKPHLCVWPGCEAAFVESSKLKSHLLSHSGSEPSVKPYVCDWPECHYKTKHKSALNRHKRTHLGLKPYSCDWTNCEAKFAQTSGLEFHTVIHTGDKK